MPFPRAYRFEVEKDGETLFHCDKVTGLDFDREYMTYPEADGTKTALTAPPNLTEFECHDFDVSEFATFFDWFKNPSEEVWAIHRKSHEGAILQTMVLENVLPRGGSWDDLDRKQTTDPHGHGYKLVGTIVEVL